MTIEQSRDASLMTARVVEHHRDGYVVRVASTDIAARLPGRFRHAADSSEALPAVGDWVTISLTDPSLAIIRELLPRRSAFVRKSAGDRATAQVVAANVDLALLTSALPSDVNLRRIERYLALAWESSAVPVVVLTKADLVGDLEPFIHDVRAVALGVDVFAISTASGAGMERLRSLLSPGVTAVVLGASGAGKSTLVNALLGDERQRVNDVRDDGAGRHTTTSRELIELPSGASIIDTPGMRELQLWSAADGLDETFRDIAEIAESCRFRDCAHCTEPGCAVNAAVADGALDPRRLESWRKLVRELAYLERRQDAAAAAAARSFARSMQHALRDRLRDKYDSSS